MHWIFFCPECDGKGNDIELSDKYEMQDDSLEIGWKCKKCGADGKINYTLYSREIWDDEEEEWIEV